MQFLNSVRVYMWFSPKPEYFYYFSNCRGISANFPTTGTFVQFLYLLGVFLQLSGQQRDLLVILHPPGTFLQFPTLQGHFCTFPRKLGYFCNFLLSKGFSAIFQASKGISAIFQARREFPTLAGTARALRLHNVRRKTSILAERNANVGALKPLARPDNGSAASTKRLQR
ncbi:hypothetical protein Taro_001760 [Colocasia esculenta]|uniref:Uncharacterized protein n=1 Tax=Colocasia esculenta TaxID=4460 RepID=A0A843TC07_COLES|nr:hypothetical protein [Colocasia esculenta]